MDCQRCIVMHPETIQYEVAFELWTESDTMWPGLCFRCARELFMQVPFLRLDYIPLAGGNHDG